LLGTNFTAVSDRVRHVERKWDYVLRGKQDEKRASNQDETVSPQGAVNLSGQVSRI
jgi:hypothetical protein